MIAICAYISFQAAGVPVPGYAWQNLFTGQTRTYDGRSHVFQAFRISDSAGARGGDRSQGRLVLNLNQLALNVLAEARASTQAVAHAIEAQRDFWLADTDLQLALTGTSPGSLLPLQSSTNTSNSPASH